MKQTHTPGPWTVAMQGGPLKPVVYRVNEAIKAKHTEHLENAQLISAAPELLEALELVMRVNPGAVYISGVDGEMYAEWVLATRAINKARGQS